MNDEKLISLVETRPAIYDKTNLYYNHKTHIRNMWKEIATELHATVPNCQKRWRYLRDYFVRQLHMTQNQCESPSSSSRCFSTKKRSPWAMFDKMYFLAPYSSTRKIRLKSEVQGDNNSPHDEHDGGYAFSISSTSSMQDLSELDYASLVQVHYASEEHDQMQNGDNSYEKKDEVNKRIDNEKTERRGKRRKSQIYDELLALLRQSNEHCDEHEHFFKSLLGTVRQIDEGHILSFRSEILQLVMKYSQTGQEINLIDQTDSNSDVVVIETGEKHWRQKLRYY